MKYLFFVFFGGVIICGCSKSFELSGKDLEGIMLKGPGKAHKIAIEVQAQSSCKTEILLSLNGFKYHIPINGTIDTIFSSDWYSRKIFVKAEYDSCVVNSPVVNLKIHNLIDL